jgi:hypothetical protein
MLQRGGVRMNRRKIGKEDDEGEETAKSRKRSLAYKSVF